MISCFALQKYCIMLNSFQKKSLFSCDIEKMCIFATSK